MTAQTGIRCAVLRGGTSKGLYFRAEDLPADRTVRDAVLLAAMGSPDEREIDGMGGGHPLTSKVAVIRRSAREDADVDYLFLQVWPDRAEVSDNQNCGNLLAGVGPFALETGLIAFQRDLTDVRIWMENTQSLAVAHVATPDGAVRYDGDARIDGVPGTHAPIPIDFLDIAGSSCGALLPTGNAVDEVEGVRVTCIDNGMPVVCVAAADLGVNGDESPAELEANSALTTKVESIRLTAGRLMNLGDVTNKTVPKVSLLSAARNGGVVDTRTFIPKRVHDAIGVFGAVSVATACVVPGSVAADIAKLAPGGGALTMDIEHPTGFFSVSMDVEVDGDKVDGDKVDGDKVDGDKVDGEKVIVHQAALLRTARLLMQGDVFVPAAVWSGP